LIQPGSSPTLTVMPQQLVPVIFVAIAVLVIAAFIFGIIAEKKRREALLAWATAHNLSFSPDRDHSFMHQFPELTCLKSGEQDRYAYNIVSGAWGSYPVVAFDYHYQTTSTDDKGRRQTHDHHFSAVIVDTPLPLKPLVIRPESIFDKIGAFFGYEDINFESAEFSRKFCVKGPDRKFAYDLLHARAIEFLLERPRRTIQIEPAHAIIHDDSTYDPAGFQSALETLTGLFDQIPNYLREELNNA
jgi:hypothetical protein